MGTKATHGRSVILNDMSHAFRVNAPTGFGDQKVVGSAENIFQDGTINLSIPACRTRSSQLQLCSGTSPTVISRTVEYFARQALTTASISSLLVTNA